MAYLLRRGDIKNIVKVEENDAVEVNPKELLKEGVQDNEPFSLINYALTLTVYDATLSKNSIYNGLDFLINQVKDKDKFQVEWQGVLNWWTHILIDIDNVEGMIVLYWLYRIGNLNIQSLDADVIKTLSDAYINNSNIIEDHLFSEVLHISENEWLG